MGMSGMEIVMIGPPGAGKGTQAVGLAEALHVPRISTGDILRAAAAAGTAVGRKAKDFMDSGRLVPDDLVVGIVEERLREPDCAGGFLLDGFPRTTPQAEALDAALRRAGRAVRLVLAIEVPDEEVLARLGGRRNCVSCGRIRHVSFDTPPSPGRCECGGALVRRDDDRDETIRDRLAVYRSQTAPLLEYYGARGLLRRVAGVGTPLEVRARVGEAVGSA